MLSLRVVWVNQVLHKFSVIHRRASGSHFHIPPPGMRLKGQKDPAGPMFLVFIMVAFGLARTHREDRPHIAKEQAWTCIKTHERAQGILGSSILIEHLFHGPE